MPRSREIMRRIRRSRIKNRLCYDCGKKLSQNYKKTRCKYCLEKERLREHRRVRHDRHILSLRKQLTNEEGLTQGETEKISNKLEVMDNKVTIELGAGMEIGIPIKQQMTAEEFINISKTVQKIKELNSKLI